MVLLFAMCATTLVLSFGLLAKALTCRPMRYVGPYGVIPGKAEDKAEDLEG